MPGPLALAGYVLAAGAISKVGDMFTQNLDVGILDKNYQAFAKDPILIPDIGQVLGMWRSRLIGEAYSDRALEMQGVAFGPKWKGTVWEYHRHLWHRVAEWTRPRPDLVSVVAGKSRGFLTKENADRLWAYHGGNPVDWQWVYDLLRYWLPPGQLQELENRGLLEKQEFSKFIQSFGGTTCRQTELIDKLRHQLPPITDVIRFALREVFSPKLRDELKLLDEYPKMLDTASKLVGYSTWQAAAKDENLKEFDISIPQAYWAAHWQPISPSQSYTMFHRLRKPFFFGDGAERRKYPAFTQADVIRWLRVSDYPPGIRPYLAQISYSVVTRVDVRRLRKAGVWDKERVKEAYLDRGYKPEDAQALADWTEKDVFATKRQPYIETFRRELLAAYKIGTLNRESAYEQLYSTEQDEKDVEQVAAKVNLMLDTVDISNATDLVQRAIGAAKTDYLEGAIDRDSAQAILARMNLTQARIDEYLANWDLDRSHAQRAATTSKVGDWYVSGYLSKEQASFRLSNLGWSEPDRALYLLEWDTAVSDKRMLAQMQAARTETQKARAQQQALDRQRREARMARAEFARTSSPVWIRKWWRKKLVSDEEIWEWLRIQEWPDDRIQRFLSEIEEEQEANGTPS